MELNREQEQLILASLLGDGYLKVSGDHKEILFTHTTKHREYLEWKRNILLPTMNVGKISERRYEQGYSNQSFRFGNRGGAFSDYYKEWRRISRTTRSNRGRKKISLALLNKLDAFGLAVWWMDDGSLTVRNYTRYGKLCTEAYNYEEHILMRDYFRRKWGIEPVIREEKGRYYFLGFPVEQTKRMIEIVHKTVLEVPCMHYKVDMKYINEKNLGEFSEVYFYIKSKTNRISETAGCAR